MPPIVLGASASQLRIARARVWLSERDAGEPVLIVAATPEAASDLLRAVAFEQGACFGWHRAATDRGGGVHLARVWRR